MVITSYTRVEGDALSTLKVVRQLKLQIAEIPDEPERKVLLEIVDHLEQSRSLTLFERDEEFKWASLLHFLQLVYSVFFRLNFEAPDLGRISSHQGEIKKAIGSLSKLLKKKITKKSFSSTPIQLTGDARMQKILKQTNEFISDPRPGTFNMAEFVQLILIIFEQKISEQSEESARWRSLLTNSPSEQLSAGLIKKNKKIVQVIKIAKNSLGANYPSFINDFLKSPPIKEQLSIKEDDQLDSINGLIKRLKI